MSGLLPALLTRSNTKQALQRHLAIIHSHFRRRTLASTVHQMSRESTENATSSKVPLGYSDNFWLWDAKTGWDLTRSKVNEQDKSSQHLTLPCEISDVVIDTEKAALVIVDMLNYSLSSAFNTDLFAEALQVEKALLSYGVPAARKAKIQVIWLNWGLTEDELKTMPPSQMRVFNFRANSQRSDYGLSTMSMGADGERQRVVCGESPRTAAMVETLVTLSDGSKIQGRRLLMKDAWNSALHHPLQAVYEEGLKTSKPDVLIHKNRNSGLWSSSTELHKFLLDRGITTLLLAGINTDQCVMATLQDAHARGFDTIFLRDGCGTDSPSYAQESSEYNACRNWGFLTTCKTVLQAVEHSRESAASVAVE